MSGLLKHLIKDDCEPVWLKGEYYVSGKDPDTGKRRNVNVVDLTEEEWRKYVCWRLRGKVEEP